MFSYTHKLVRTVDNYSYRIASSGFNLDARRAGKIPVRYPTIAEKSAIKLKKSSGKEKRATAWPPNCPATILRKTFTVTPNTTPIKIPLRPPKNPTTIDSDTNKYFTSFGAAPIVRIIPISFVRSS